MGPKRGDCWEWWMRGRSGVWAYEEYLLFVGDLLSWEAQRRMLGRKREQKETGVHRKPVVITIDIQNRKVLLVIFPSELIIARLTPYYCTWNRCWYPIPMICFGICASIDAFMLLQLRFCIVSLSKRGSVLEESSPKKELLLAVPSSSARFSSYHCPNPVDIVSQVVVFQYTLVQWLHSVVVTIRACHFPLIRIYNSAESFRLTLDKFYIWPVTRLSITSLDSQSTSQFHQSLHQRYQSSQEPWPPLKLGEEYYHSIGSYCELLRWVVWSIKTRFTVNRWQIIIGSLFHLGQIFQKMPTPNRRKFVVKKTRAFY